MKKLKLVLTYLVALICVATTLTSKQESVPVFYEGASNNEQRELIYMIDEKKELVPVQISMEQNDSREEMILQLISVMKQEIEFYDLQALLPQRVQCLSVKVTDHLVQLNFNEAFLTLNSDYDLRVIEAIVSVITLLDGEYQVEFLVNSRSVKEMPLSRLPMKIFDASLGINNFEISHENLHSSISRQIVRYDEDKDYYTVGAMRLENMDDLSFVNRCLKEQKRRQSLECEKVVIQENKTVLYLNEVFLLEENLVDDSLILPLLFTMKMNHMGEVFELMIEDEPVKMQGVSTFEINFKKLKLNTFE